MDEVGSCIFKNQQNLPTVFMMMPVDVAFVLLSFSFNFITQDQQNTYWHP